MNTSRIVGSDCPRATKGAGVKERTMRKEFYNIQDEDGEIHKILVYESWQNTPTVRELTVGKRSIAWKLPGPCYAMPPTPYRPLVIFRSK
jgi:hypothetical protein